MNGRTDNRISQADWLELARQQSNKLAECRAAHVPSLDWERITGRIARARGGSSAPLRLSWALWVLLPVLILGGAGGTWAFVRHLRNGPAKSVASVPVVEPAGERLVPAATKRSVTTPTAKESPKMEQKATPAPAPAKKHRARPQPKNDHKEVASATQAKPDKKTTHRGTERITFGTSDNPGGGAIIVPPPAKLKPLWTPETYKKRGRRNASW